MESTRRTLIGLIGGLPFVGKAVGPQVMQNIKSSGTLPGLQAGMQSAQQSAMQTLKPSEPKMQSYEVWKILFQNKETRDEYTSALYARYKGISQIDPDIDVLKSFSKMAKITFQRRRIVQRQIEFNIDKTNYGTIENKIQTYFDKIMWGK